MFKDSADKSNIVHKQKCTFNVNGMTIVAIVAKDIVDYVQNLAHGLQKRIAETTWQTDYLQVPTGLGKTTPAVYTA